MQSARLQAELRYRDIRQLVYKVVETELRTLEPAVALTEISEAVLRQTDAWRSLYPSSLLTHKPGWSWRRVAEKFRCRPRRIEVALWHDNLVCGLAVGRVSDKRVIATIHFVESLPVANPLKGKVVPFLVRFLEAMSVNLGCEAVSIEQPATELIAYYSDIGFKRIVKKGGRVLRQIKRLSTADY